MKFDKLRDMNGRVVTEFYPAEKHKKVLLSETDIITVRLLRDELATLTLGREGEVRLELAECILKQSDRQDFST